MRFPLALLLFGAGGLALAWGAHDLTQFLLQSEGCSVDAADLCPPGTQLALGIAVSGLAAILLGAFIGRSIRTRLLALGLLGTTVAASVAWSQLGTSAQPEGASTSALAVAGISALAGLLLFVSSVARDPSSSSVGGNFWSFDSGGDSGGDSGCSSGCGGGCGGGD